MGISSYLAELIVREHLYKPLPATVHTVGRLVVGLDFKQACSLLQRLGVKRVEVEPEIDRHTIEARRIYEETGIQFITDRTFFGMLGVTQVLSIDINAYEGAGIVWDLCMPIADHMADTADFIVGGSTLDNIFDPAQYMRNIARLLKPRGRIFEFNIYIDRMRPYVILPPAWYYDFFVVNSFDDCKVYVAEHVNDKVHAYKVLVPLNPEQQPTWGLINNFEPSGETIVNLISFAEKGTNSTWNVSPVQDSWRNKDRISRYNECLSRVLNNPRPYHQLTVDGDRPPSLVAHLPPMNYHYIGHF